MPKLHNLKHEVFCRTYVSDKRVRLNATRSYMKAYPRASYKTALVNGPVLLGKTRERVAEIMEEGEIQGETLIHSLSRLMEAKKPVMYQGRIIAHVPDNRNRLEVLKILLKVQGVR